MVMTIKDAIIKRHTVRKYTDRKIPDDIVNQLIERINHNNDQYGLKMKLVLENTEAFSGMIKLILAKGVRNYIVLAGDDRAGIDEQLGYCGTDVMLFAQALGLNTWWVGGTYDKKGVKKNAGAGTAKVAGIIVVGYGAVQGVPHKSKQADEVSQYHGAAPDWFVQGVKAALLAPTALNKQAFYIKGDGNKVSITCHNGNFSDIDLGIVKYHFEVGAGQENFEWV